MLFKYQSCAFFPPFPYCNPLFSRYLSKILKINDRAHTLMAIVISYHFFVSLILNHVRSLNTIQQSTNKAIIDTQANLLLQKQVGWNFLPLREKKEKQRETKTKVNEIHQFVNGKTAISNALWLHRSSGRDMI